MPFKDKAKRNEYMRNYRTKHSKYQQQIYVLPNGHKIIVEYPKQNIIEDALFFAKIVHGLKKEEGEKQTNE